MKTILRPIEQGMMYAVKILSFMVIKIFVFQVEPFKFLKIHENETKYDKGNFKKGLIMTFKVKNL